MSHGAHVPRRAACADRAGDPRRCRAGAEYRTRGAVAATAGGLRGAAEFHGRVADHDPAARPPAARVLARPRRADGAGRAGTGARGTHRGRRTAAGGRAAAARVEPDARLARGAARSGGARLVRAAGAGHRGSHRRVHQGRRKSPPGDHGSLGRFGDGAAPGPGRGGHHPRRGCRTRRCGADDSGRDDGGAAPRGTDGPPDRGSGRFLLLRYQRPHPDHVGVFPRRRGGRILCRLPRQGCLQGVTVRDSRRRRCRPPGADRHHRRPGR